MSELPPELDDLVPIPILPRHPGWVNAYRQAWADLWRQRDVTEAAALLDDLWQRMGRPVGGAAREVQVPWSGPPLELIVLLLSQVIGVKWPGAGDALVWHLWEEPPVGVRNLRLAGNIVSLVAEADEGGGIVVVVEARRPFDLEIETEFTTFSEQVPAGRTRYLLTYLDRTDVRQA
jgi:hypothetical protein